MVETLHPRNPCPKCGFDSSRFGRVGTCEDAIHELYSITLTLPRPPFVHQLAVDAYSAQHLGGQMSPVTKLFPLMGLFMVCEQGANGLDVQQAHMNKSKEADREDWPTIELLPVRFDLNVGHVLEAIEDNLESAIRDWVESTMYALRAHEHEIRQFCSRV